MERHQEKLLALCRICGVKIKDHRRKVHASKLSAEVDKIWQVSVLVESGLFNTVLSLGGRGARD